MTVVGFFLRHQQCGEQATQVCGTCYSVEVPLTGFLLMLLIYRCYRGTMLRKPNLDEVFYKLQK
jgi:hypothetical protein